MVKPPRKERRAASSSTASCRKHQTSAQQHDAQLAKQGELSDPPKPKKRIRPSSTTSVAGSRPLIRSHDGSTKRRPDRQSNSSEHQSDGKILQATDERHHRQVYQAVVVTIHESPIKGGDDRVVSISLDPPMEQYSKIDLPQTSTTAGNNAGKKKRQKHRKGERSQRTTSLQVVRYEEQLEIIQQKPAPAPKSMEYYLNNESTTTIHPNTPKCHDDSILYLDDDIVVVNKPPGVPSVPDMKGSANLLHWVWEHYGKTTAPANGVNPNLPSATSMLVHRLDRDTSGVVVFGRSLEATRQLDAAFRDRAQVQKTYEALLCGHLPDSMGTASSQEDFDFTIDLPLQRDPNHPPFTCVGTYNTFRDGQLLAHELKAAGYKKQFGKYQPKSSLTMVRILDRSHVEFRNQYGVEPHQNTDMWPVTRVSLAPKTGRNHQLRVHCAALGFPIVGDNMYCSSGDSASNGGLTDLPWQLQSPAKTATEKIDGKRQTASEYLLEFEASQLSSRGQTALLEQPLCLHAASLTLPHPMSGKVMTWKAPVPF